MYFSTLKLCQLPWAAAAQTLKPNNTQLYRPTNISTKRDADFKHNQSGTGFEKLHRNTFQHQVSFTKTHSSGSEMFKCYIPAMTERQKLLCSLDSSTQLLNVEEKGLSEHTEVDLYQHGAASCDTPTCSKTSLLAPQQVRGFNYSQIHKVFRHMHHFELLKHFKFFLCTCWKCKQCFQVE